ncbi:nucleotidyltransferase family protein [Natrialba swarupiae]|uniref:Nucleotidyltransferase family protein n=1 Tax=Natrialba swarupiae TaxID=2448032 RepID=A0A5D5AM61_9EURY|nr:nucleotidyltransferase family protein [Natrialba swarupiae]TYT62005.1 nucleotidyltransferase family protein [Natrialba swarupiae]
MFAVVPAAGRGSRLRPLTDSRPKGMVEIDGEPILTYCFDRLVEVSVESIVVVGYRGQRIVEYYGEAYDGTPIQYVEQRDRLGLAHAVEQAEDVVDGDFLVLNGDNVFEFSLESLVRTHRRSDVDATILVEEAPPAVARTTGVVVTDDDGTVVRIEEKPDEPDSSLVTTGVYTLPESTFRHCSAISPSDRGEYELADAINRLRRQGAVIRAIELDEWRVNVNTPADLETATRELHR